MSGKLYGVGVGPGDPELITLKALRLMKEADAILVPGTEPSESIAYQIAKGAYHDIHEKMVYAIPMPMTKDKALLECTHKEGAETVVALLDKLEKVVFLTLGDPTVYSTYFYIHKRVLAMGYDAEIVSGIPSFCAVAARLNMGLSEQAEQIHIIPASYDVEEGLKLPGTKVLMKAGRKIRDVKEHLLSTGTDCVMIENCGMEDEKIYKSAEEIPDTAGYYSLMIVKGE